jgi:hypothetical protein
MARPRTARGSMRMLGVSLASVILLTTIPAAVATVAQEASTGGLCPADHTVPASPSAASGSTLEPSSPPSAKRPPEPADAPSRPKLGGTWRELPRSPFAAVRPLAVWAADRMVAIDPRTGRTATYDPPVRRWEEHQPLPSEPDSPTQGFDGLMWAIAAGDEVVALGSYTGPDGQWYVWYAFAPATGRWRAIAASPFERNAGGSPAWTGDLLLVVSHTGVAAAYDPAADCWLEMPSAPPGWVISSIHWTGEALLAVAGGGSRVGIFTFDPGSWTWESGAVGPVGAYWADPVLARGKLWFMTDEPVERYVSNAAYDPATDTWTEIIDDCPVDTGSATWTGELIMEPYYDRRAFDPETGACSRIPASGDRARAWEPVWTGREFIYWSGAYGDTLRAFRDGVVYRPPRQAVTDELAKPIGKRLEGAIKARRHYGFDTDPEVVREIMRDPWQPASEKFGFPMTAAEESSIWRRSAKASQAGHVQPRLRKLPTYGGLWQDQRSGGDFAIALTEADPEVLSRIDGWMAGRWRLVIVPFTEKELKRALWRVDRVSKRLDPDAMLWSAGVDLSAGGLSLMYDPDDVDRMRARKEELEMRLGVPVRITGGRVRDL